MNNITEVWSANGKIDETSYQVMISTRVIQGVPFGKGKLMVLLNGKTRGLASQKSAFLHNSKCTLTLIEKKASLSQATSMPRKYFNGPKSLI